MHSLKTTSAMALAIAAVCGLGIAGPAMAQQSVHGQGATLPAGLYPDWFAPSPVAGFNFFYNVTRGTAAATGSGAGKLSFVTHSFVTPNATPGQPNVVTTNTDVQYAGSDAILNAADITAYSTTNATTGFNTQTRFGLPIQVPSVGTPVTISYNPTGQTRTRVGPTGVVSTAGVQTNGPIIYLSRRSYCGIFSGKITNWNDASIVADNSVAPSAQPIKVVVRSDSSGTTEIFTRHLDTVCDGVTNAAGTVSYSFQDTRRAVDQDNPTTAPDNAVPPPGRTGGTTVATNDNFVNWTGMILPASRLVQAAGSGGVSTAIGANQYSIGYVSPDYTDVVLAPAPGTGSPVPVPANLQNQADIGGAANYTHSPSYVNVAAAQSSIPAPALTDSALLWGQKLNLRQGGTTPAPIDTTQSPPATQVPNLNDVRNNPTAANAYPINGFTFFDFYTCYPSTKTTGVRGLVTYYTTTSTTPGSADSEARIDGFAPLTATLKNAVRGRALATGTSPRGISSGSITGVCTL